MWKLAVTDSWNSKEYKLGKLLFIKAEKADSVCVTIYNILTDKTLGNKVQWNGIKLIVTTLYPYRGKLYNFPVSNIFIIIIIIV